MATRRSKQRLNLEALTGVYVDLLGEGGLEGSRDPKKEFRIFARGVNRATKGEFVFDDNAAEMVMSQAREHGVDFTVDYDHHTLHTDKGIKAISAGWFDLELRDGDLWAANVRWTPDAEQHLRKAEYRYFSPLFDWDEKTGRIKTLINNALTNTPALYGIDPLVAASAAHKEDPMDPELKKALDRAAELERQVATLTEEVRSSKGSAALMALSTTVGLAANAGAEDVRTAVSGLVGVRSKLLELTGQGSVPAALGTIEGWKSEAADASRLKTQIETERLAGLGTELNGILDQAGKDGKIEPSERADWEKGALAFGGGKPSKDGIAWLSGRVKAMTAKVDTAAAGGTGTKSPPGRVALSATDKFVAQRLRIPEAEWQKAEEARLAGEPPVRQ